MCKNCDCKVPCPACKRRDEILYNFDGLSEKAQQRAIEKVQQMLAKTFPCESLTAAFQEHLIAAGINAKVFWSLGNCQGDGVRLDGAFNLDKLATLPEYEPIHRDLQFFKSVELVVRFNIGRKVTTTSGFLTWAYSTTPEKFARTEKKIKKTCRGVCSWLTRHVRNMRLELEKFGYAEIEVYSGERAAREYCNEVIFTKNGCRRENQ